jgi:putative nucleotidyltransferase with HDIG domain
MEALAAVAVHDAVSGSDIPVAASVGLAVFPDEASTIEDAIRLADDAMYAEKRERQSNDGSSATRGIVADEHAARMIGEIVPLLTAPGDLDTKLRQVSHRLSVSGGYEGVRIHVDGRPASATSQYDADAADAMLVFDEPRAADRAVELRATLLQSRRPLIVHDLQIDERFSEHERAQFRAAGYRSGIIIPMRWEGAIIGTLSVAKKRAGVLDARAAQFLATVAEQVTAIIRMETLVTDLQAASGRLEDARTDTMVLLAAAAEAHEQTTGAHLQRVQVISELLARELGYDEPSAEAVGHAAILHDIGKIRVPERILLSPARLDGGEWAIMKQHTTWGAEFLAQRPGFEMAAVVAACHHERWDGAGYPRGLRGAQIPEIAQIVTVADSFDAITSDRPYRPGRPASWAIEEIVRCAGEQFSPRVVDAMQRVYAQGALTDGRPERSAAA